ncbi:MAG TPA: hypothetical protein VGE42_09835 [Candidatus Dormibacteraeota bacterium]
MRRRDTGLLRVIGEPSRLWHCGSCGEWGVCDDGDRCVLCALGEAW